jgi:hypothetical protein
MAMTDQHAAGQMMVSVREVTGGLADLGVGQFGIGQSITYLGRQHGQAHRLIMPHSLAAVDPRRPVA